jgi:exopolysaccharide biosynthesis polyprenyl glycosylphosphotransferase
MPTVTRHSQDRSVRRADHWSKAGLWDTLANRSPSRHHLLSGAAFAALLVVTDLLALTLATVQADLLGYAEMRGSMSVLVYALPVLSIVCISSRGGYRRCMRHVFLDDLGPVVGAVSVAAMLIVVCMIEIDADARPGRAVAPAWLLGSIYVTAGRMALTLLQRRARRRFHVTEPAIIVGTGLIGRHIARRLQESPEYGLHPIGYLDSTAAPQELAREPLAAPVLGTPDEMRGVIERTGARRVILAFSGQPDRDLLAALRSGQALGVDVSVVPRFFESVGKRIGLEHLGGLPLLNISFTNPKSWQFTLKHAMDRVGACILLALLGPLMLAIAVAVRLTSPGPVLFRQQRVGRDGCVFDVLKYRSMRIGEQGDGGFRPAEGIAPGGVEGSDRRTSVGRLLRRTSLDELPQLINVLKGEMSLVGPRPERPEFVVLFQQNIDRYGERHRVKAGITGWAQVNGLRGQTSLADRVEWDNYYIENWSLWLDLKILLMTVLPMLSWRHE